MTGGRSGGIWCDTRWWLERAALTLRDTPYGESFAVCVFHLRAEMLPSQHRQIDGICTQVLLTVIFRLVAIMGARIMGPGA